MPSCIASAGSCGIRSTKTHLTAPLRRGNVVRRHVRFRVVKRSTFVCLCASAFSVGAYCACIKRPDFFERRMISGMAIDLKRNPQRHAFVTQVVGPMVKLARCNTLPCYQCAFRLSAHFRFVAFQDFFGCFSVACKVSE